MSTSYYPIREPWTSVKIVKQTPSHISFTVFQDGGMAGMLTVEASVAEEAMRAFFNDADYSLQSSWHEQVYTETNGAGIFYDGAHLPDDCDVFMKENGEILTFAEILDQIGLLREHVMSIDEHNRRWDKYLRTTLPEERT